MARRPLRRRGLAPVAAPVLGPVLAPLSASVPARVLGRIWVRFGLWIAATVLLTIGILAGTMLLFAEAQYRSFERALPPPLRAEMRQLVDQDLEDSPRAIEIYGQYWKGDLLFGEKVSLLLGLGVCLPVGLIAGFWVSRTITLPLGSMAAAAQRIAQGDLGVRAEPGGKRGEMADMVRHFNDMTAALARFERDRKTTAAAISHELRTPLTILCARLHAACDGVIPADVPEFCRLLDQAEHLSRLVDDLHTLSMADAGRLPLRHAPLDLVALARDTLQRHGLRLSQHGIDAHLQAHVDSALVDGDEDRLRQVLSNLIENATRHAHAGGWLELGVGIEVAAGDRAASDEADAAAEAAPGATPGSRAGLTAGLKDDAIADEAPDSGMADAPRWAVLTVSDAGPGISEAVRRHMFTRFGDPDRPRAPAGGGSGLGLSVVHTLVLQHGGEVGVDASARGGVRFTIRLPLWDAGTEADDAGAAAASAA